MKASEALPVQVTVRSLVEAATLPVLAVAPIAYLVLVTLKTTLVIVAPLAGVIVSTSPLYQRAWSSPICDKFWFTCVNKNSHASDAYVVFRILPLSLFVIVVTVPVPSYVAPSATKATTSALAEIANPAKHRIDSKFVDLDVSGYREIDDSVFDVYDIVDVQRGLEQLPTEMKNILELKLVYGLESKEIAAIYGISNDNARKKVQRGKKALMKFLVED